MKITNKLAFASTSTLLCLSSFTLVIAQEEESVLDENLTLDEIVVTGRKREETLQDIPVSASVLSNALIEDAGITNLYDMFELIPGLHFDEGAEQDRLSALPSIRGIQSNDIASNRTKVTSFIDGIPVLGAAGTIGFNGFQQVEVYRGPQSAAFGRSTFAGAINYVTRDPGEEFAGDLGININDYGSRTLNANFDIPINDKIGMLLSASVTDSSSPDDYHATGNAGERQIVDQTTGTEYSLNNNMSDGTEYGSQSGENISAKLVFTPTDALKASFTFSHVNTHDNGNPEFYLTEEGRAECFDGSGLVADVGMTSIYRTGTYDCDWTNYRENYAHHSDLEWLMDNPLLLDSVVNNAIDMGAMENEFAGQTLSVEEQVLALAELYSIPENERGTKSERNRFTAQLDWLLDSGNAVQFSYMHAEETGQRLSDSGRIFSYDPFDLNLPGFNLTELDGSALENIAGATPGTGINYDGTWQMDSGMGAPRVIGGTETDLTEDYFEFRWVSPAEDRLRYVVGVSYYDYEFLEERYGDDMRDDGGQPSPLSAGVTGQVELWEALTGSRWFADSGTIGEETTNTAAFFNVNYDLTEKITLSVEGRLQSDKVSSTNVDSGESEGITTESFVPRISINYNIDDNTSLYAQWSKGVNPAGINTSALDIDTIAVVNEGIEQPFVRFDDANFVDNWDATNLVAGQDGLIDGYNPDDGLYYTDETYSTLLDGGQNFEADFEGTSDFLSYKEEELTNYEIGFKGNLFDGRMSYAGAIFYIDWKNQLQSGSLDLAAPCTDNGEAGQLDAVPCEVDGVEYLWTSTVAGSTPNVGLNFGDVITKGIELEGTFRVTSQLNIRAQASYLDAKYDDYCDISLYDSADFSNNQDYIDALGLVIVEPGEGDTLTSTCYDTSGNEVAGQPSFSGSISPSYSMDIAGINLNTRLDLRYEGEQWVESANYSKYPASTTANFSVSANKNNWSATLYVNNLLDDDSPRRVSSGGDDTDVIGLIATGNVANPIDAAGVERDLSRDNYRFSPATPRTIGLRASYRF